MSKHVVLIWPRIGVRVKHKSHQSCRSKFCKLKSEVNEAARCKENVGGSSGRARLLFEGAH
eukprot:7919613-Lingulodinium_polyedra.AAC.1